MSKDFKSFLHRTLIFLGLSACWANASAEIIEGEGFCWEWIGDGAYLWSVYTVPSDGILNIPDNIQAYNGEISVTLPVKGSFVDFVNIPGSQYICEIHLPKNFQYINMAPGGIDFSDRGIMQVKQNKDFKGIYVDPESPYFKTVDGMLLSKDGKELYAIPARPKDNAMVLNVPEGVEICHTTGASRFVGYEAVALPSTLKKSATDFGGFPFIIANSTEPFSLAETSPRQYLENTYLYIPKGSRDNYMQAAHWNKIISWVNVAEVEEMSADKMVEVRFDNVPEDHISCKINGKDVRRLSVKPNEVAKIEIAGDYRKEIWENDELLSDDDHRLSEDGRTIVCYPRGNTTFTIAVPQEKVCNDFKFETIGNNQARIIGYNGDVADYPTRITIPQYVSCDGKQYTVTEVGGFEGCGIEQVSFPATLRKILWNAFANNNLTEIILPQNLKEIGGYAFENNRLTEITFPESLEKTVCSFAGNNITSLTIPERLRYCDFRGNDFRYVCIKSTPSSMLIDNFLREAGGPDNRIEEIVLDSSDIEFDIHIDVECDQLTVRRPFKGNILGIKERLIYESEDVTLLPFNKFDYMPQTWIRHFPNEIILKGNKVEIGSIINGTIGSWLINSSPTRWMGMLNEMKKIDIQCSELKLADFAFANMKSLSSLNIDVSRPCDFAACALYNCESLTSVELPSVDGLPLGALQNCKNLKELSLPASARFINSLALRGCENLHKFDIKSSAEPLVVGVGAFEEIELQELSLGRDVVSSDMPFYGLKSLRKLTITSNVTELPDYAFAECINLKEIYCESSIAPKIGSNTFRGVSREECKVYVLGDDGDYRLTDGWKDFFNSVEEIPMHDNTIKVYSTGDILCVKSDKDCLLSVYSFNGLEVVRQNIQKGESNFAVAPGYYIIVADGKIYKHNHSTN